MIVVWGDPDPALLTDIDPARAGADHMPLTPALFAAVGGGEVNWTFVPGPCEGIAQRLLGTPDLDQLWSLIAPIIRLDQDDPVGAWRDHLAAAGAACRTARGARVRRAALLRSRRPT